MNKATNETDSYIKRLQQANFSEEEIEAGLTFPSDQELHERGSCLIDETKGEIVHINRGSQWRVSD